MPPRLKPPWNIDMVGSRKAFSTAMPWAFMATSMLPIDIPIRKPATTNVVMSGASIGSEEGEAEEDAGDAAHPGAAEAVDQHAGDGHGHDRAAGKGQQGQPEDRRTGIEAFLGQGNMRHPGSDQDAVQQEHGTHGPAGRTASIKVMAGRFV